MIIGGLVRFSLNDYPGKTSAVIFTRGCNFRCRYCHNPELVLPERFGEAPEIPEGEVLKFLESRKGKLDAVVITGGEPTNHSDLPNFLKKIKKMGFLAKLDTNGTNSAMLGKIIKKGNVDYIAMDIKAPLDSDSYKKIIDVPADIEKLKKSIRIILESGLPHEFRTTIVKSLTSFDDLRRIVRSIKGAQNYFLQKFVPSKLNDESLMKETSYSDEELNKLSTEFSTLVKRCGVR